MVDGEVIELSADPPEPELRIKRLRASLSSRSPSASYEASIRLGDDTLIEGVSVGRHKLTIELEKKLFQRFDTRAKLLTAADDPKFVETISWWRSLVEKGYMPSLAAATSGVGTFAGTWLRVPAASG